MFAAAGQNNIMVIALVAFVVVVCSIPAGAQKVVVFETHAPPGGQYEGDIDVSAQCISPTGERLWNDGDLIDIMSGTYIEQAPSVVDDGAGGLLVFAEAVAREGQYAGDWEIIGQRINRNGRLMWEDGDRSVLIAGSAWSERNPVAIPDGRGGAFVFYEAYAPANSEWAGDIDIRGQHVSASGELLWEENGIPVATGTALEKAPVVISDGAGGAIVVFQVMLQEGESANTWHIAAQRVSPDGELLWEGGERSVIVAASDWQETRPVAVPDGEGGALIFFQGEARGGQYAGDFDIMGQRVSADGRLLWENGERSVAVFSSAALERAPVAVSDGRGGAVVICEGAAREGQYAGDWEILAQRVSPQGELLWNDGTSPVIVSATTFSEHSPCAIADGAGGAFVAFEAHAPAGSEWAGDVDVLAQRISADGRPLWGGENGALVVSSSGDYLERYPCIAADGEGGVLVIFEAVARAGQYAGDWEVAGQRIAPDGTVMWNNGESASMVSASSWSEHHPVMANCSIGWREEEGEAGGAQPDTRPAGTKVNPAKP